MLEVPASAAKFFGDFASLALAGHVARFFGADAILRRVLNGDEFFSAAGGVSYFREVHFSYSVVRFDEITIPKARDRVLAKSAIARLFPPPVR